MDLTKCFGRTKRTPEKRSKEKLALKQKFSHGVGHILNDLAANAWFSYLLIYLTKVAGLSNSHTGYVAMSGQVIDGFCTPVIAILNDKTVCRYGRRKIWHLIGWVALCISFPLLFTQCLPHDTSSALKLAFYIGIAGIMQFGWGCMQISHLSLIPEISRRESERVELNAIRSGLRFVCGIFVFGVTWILIGKSNETTISPGMWKQFMYLGLIIVGTGSVFNLIFHIWTKEPPSEALLRWKENRSKTRPYEMRRNESEAKALLEAVYQPSRQGGASPAVVVKLINKPQWSPVPAVKSFTEKTGDKTSGLQIIERNASHGEGRTNIQWLKSPMLYKTGFVYICTRLYVNLSQSYLPLYLIETMKFQKEAIAYFPLVVLVTGVLTSAGVKPLTKRLGSKITFILGALIAISASFWFQIQSVDGRNAVYATAGLMGSGGSVMLITSLSMIADLIGEDKKSGAFVYGAIGFFDKVVSGIVIVIIQECNPRTDQSAECFLCDEYLRHVQSFAPGAPAVLALIAVLVFFNSIFTCSRKVQMVHIATQTNSDEHDDDIGTSDVTTLPSSSETLQDGSSVENGSENGTTHIDQFVHRSFTNIFTPPGTVENYVAMRLASHFAPSPILQRKKMVFP